MAIDLGDLYRCSFTLTSPAGALVSADIMTLTVTRPDGTPAVVPNPITPTSPGVYQYDYQTVQAGRHVQRWVGTGANPGAHTDAFDVRPADAPYITSLADAKQQLNMTTATSDEEVRSFLEAATGVVEDELGQAVVRRSFTEEHTVTGALVLNWTPVVSLSSVALINGTHTWDVSTLHVSPAGVVTSLGGVALSGRVTVTYVAGMAIIPRAYAQASMIILQNLWETQRARSGSPRPGVTDGTRIPGSSYALPNQAKELLGGGMPGIA